MDNKEAIIQATISLITEKGEQLNEITVREICKKANVGLGLVNYHFENKDKLIELCVERMVNGIVDNFRSMQEKTEGLTPFETLDYLGNITLTFLFDHYAVSKISILTDMRTPKEDDNTHRTYLAYLPLVSACRPDWDKATVEHKTFCLIAIMQQTFLRHKVVSETQGIDLTNPEERKAFHTQILHDILEV
ncbi:TetR/AcrR family transcriptional regulator [Ruminococcus sp. 5_1_39BFAA]|uniref:TetR/AcrR family transcriptional regulator n=1 Tax=Ruminococcus sp. 5_1_39BFAA TaxID=457412 RepID=UPI0035615986